MITPGFSLTATERVLPRLALDFTTASLDPRVTFTRAGNTATVTNSSGLVALINANLPRFDFDPITLACKGLLIEEARTNLQTYSEQFNHGSWTKFNTTVTADSTTAPDGTLTADSLIENTANSFHTIDGIYVPATATGNFTSSVYLKAKGRNFIRLFVTQETPGVNYSALFNLTTGTLVSSDVGVTATISDAGNGWYRGTVSTTILASSRARLTIGLQNASGAIAPYAGDGTSGCYVWGAQIEVGAFPTSYIPTVASTVLRNADTAVMTGTNFSSWFNQSQGSFMARFAGAVKTSTWAFQMDSGGGNFANRIACAPTTNNNLIVSDSGGTNQCTIGNYIGSDNVFVNITGAYNTNNFATSYNGTSAVQDTSGSPASPTAIVIGARNTASPNGFLNSWIQKFYYWPQQLTVAEVQAFSK